ncbi:MAG: hypothetical protein KC486_05400 [Myxococcales bacterium]|nr:hypothetical protein [Myxococcales bacterium]
MTKTSLRLSNALAVVVASGALFALLAALAKGEESAHIIATSSVVIVAVALLAGLFLRTWGRGERGVHTLSTALVGLLFVDLLSLGLLLAELQPSFARMDDEGIVGWLALGLAGALAAAQAVGLIAAAALAWRSEGSRR